MKYMTAKEIREAFISYFESKGHRHVDSSSLVPHNDNTLLFTNAGMVQFKDVFLGVDKRDYSRATTAQRCVRAGGKHNDLDTVGRTARHHTFFEMMGNFSFGDYFKRDAISFAWEFLTQVLELPKDKLYATVYEKDDEAFALWQEITGLTADRIFRIGAKDNFWAMGDTGPCGPCSEIFFDRGEKYTCDAPECGIGKCDCDRWMEIWNLVFMQYERDEKGELTPLPRPSIDTGMGLERVASILQGVDSNYDTDIMRGIIHGVEELTNLEYHGDQRGFPFRVIADHARSCSFMIADGIMPSNEGRGYVLRRILRRAARFGMTLGLTEPFLYKMVPLVSSSMGDAYPIIREKEEHVTRAIKMEEERFHTTLQAGMGIVNTIIARMKQAGQTQISGSDLFMLYDTYGFPLDLAKDIAEENNFTIDEAGFQACMDAQRAKAKQAQKEAGGEDMSLILGQMLLSVPLNRFLGYTQLEAQAQIRAIVVNKEMRERAMAGEEGWLALDNSPFYAEQGGQIGDTGLVIGPLGTAEIIDTQKLHSGLFVHKFVVKNGEIHKDDVLAAKVDVTRRMAIARNHSATHLLHKALRMVLGDQVHQAGSLVTDERLRFDFNYFEPLTLEQLQQIEDIVNNAILSNMEITTREMPLEEAKSTGAMAFFDEKYGDIVRVVSMGDFSHELCGGTHCQHTGDIGLIKVLGESGIGSGMRRVEALTGTGALQYHRQQEEKLSRVAAALKTTTANVEKRLESILQENRQLAKENDKLQAQLHSNSIEDLWKNAEQLQGISILSAQVEAADVPALRSIMDMLRDRLPDSAIILAAAMEDKVAFVAAVSEKAKAAGLHAGKIIKDVAAVCGGSGGGRPDMAQAGGKDSNPEKIQAALEKGRNLIKTALS